MRVVLGVAGEAPGAGGAADHVERGGAVLEEFAEQVLIEAEQGHPFGAAASAHYHGEVLLAQAVVEQVLAGAGAGDQLQGFHLATCSLMLLWGRSVVILRAFVVG